MLTVGVLQQSNRARLEWLEINNSGAETLKEHSYGVTRCASSYSTVKTGSSRTCAVDGAAVGIEIRVC